MAGQLTGEYQVRAPHLRPYLNVCHSLLDSIPTWRVEHVLRERNALADQLATSAIDCYQDSEEQRGAVKLEVAPDSVQEAADRSTET